MLKKIFTILFLMMIANSFSQKIMEKQFDASGIEHIIIDGTGIFKIDVISEKRNNISLKTEVAGETFQNIVISEKATQNQLKFSAEYSPYFEPENDKLAAHKVISIEMKLKIPEGMQVEIISDIGSVETKGNFKSLLVELENGTAKIADFSGNGIINTAQGNIYVEAQSNVSGVANSKNGHIENLLPKNGKFSIKAESREGDIGLFQTKK